MSDPYTDPALGILRNLVRARTRAELDEREADATAVRMVLLAERPVPLTGDLAQLREIHRRLFGDVYEWAGRLRTVDLWKPGGAPFLPVSRLSTGAEYAFGQLGEERMLAGLDRERFVGRLAVHYDQVNFLHPFREGNGRTQRVFWSQVAEAAGWVLDWRRTGRAENDAASRTATEHGDLAPLRRMFAAVVQAPDAPRLPGGQVQAVRVARSSFGAAPTGPAVSAEPTPRAGQGPERGRSRGRGI